MSYTVVAGDSLSSIAERFGLSVDELAAYNEIDDPSIIQVGQVLLIPTEDEIVRLATPETSAVYARPGETLAALAQRVGQDSSALSTLNDLDAESRLFPGQPIGVPRDQAPTEPLRFGAISAVDYTDSLVQGRTGMLTVTADRPLFLEATLHDIPLVFTPLKDDSLRYFAYLPTPALWDPGIYPLTVSYLAGRGLPVSRTWTVSVADGGYASQQIVVPDEKGDLLDPAVVYEEEARVNAVWSQLSPESNWAPIVERPVNSEYPTTSPFGSRRVYSGGGFNSTGYHAGQDFAAPATVAAAAPATGTVALAEPMAIRGNAVIIDHGRGVLTGYWHLSELFVEEGQTINAGDLLGMVGTTGRSTGPHLHWELRIYGVAVDPMQFLAEPLTQ